MLVGVGFLITTLGSKTDTKVSSLSSSEAGIPATAQTAELDGEMIIFNSLKEMDAHAKLVVRGTIISATTSTYMPESMKVAQLPPEKAKHAGIAKTIFGVKVEQVLGGDSSLIGKVINVVQLGGYDATTNTNYVMNGDPISEKGKTYLFFLSDTNPDGSRASVGGPQGRFLVESNKLKAVSTDSSNLPVAKELVGKDLANLEKNYRQLVGRQ